MKPRTGDGPLEVTKEGRGIVMRVPLEGGGRLVVELSADEAAQLSECAQVRHRLNLADRHTADRGCHHGPRPLAELPRRAGRRRPRRYKRAGAIVVPVRAPESAGIDSYLGSPRPSVIARCEASRQG